VSDDRFQGSGEGNDTSFAGEHAPTPERKLNVAPTDGSAKFNAIRIPLVPVACWRLNDPAFDFDSSFVSPSFRGEIVPTEPSDPPAAGAPRRSASNLTRLSTTVDAHRECPIALFGHCDPAGGDDLNKTLGDRRAIAIYALLTKQPPLWEDIYAHPAVGDTWGTKAIQTMLAHVTGRATDDAGNPVADPASNPYYSGAIDGNQGPVTTKAIKAFQTDTGNTPDGQAGPKTRDALFGAYMDWLCTPDAPASGPPPKRLLLQPADFLGGQGAGPGDLPKMSLQSCGKYNPIVLLPSSEMNQSDTTSRNEDDAPNRRVILFFFPKGTTVADGQWPCPKVKESNAACSANFWPDGDTRRKNGDTRREYRITRDTMACRFYDRFARRSPCEWGYPEAHRVAVEVDDVTIAMGIPNAPLTISDSGAPKVSVPIDNQGKGNFYASTTSADVFGLDDVHDIAIGTPAATP
jgi:hypothetical protein